MKPIFQKWLPSAILATFAAGMIAAIAAMQAHSRYDEAVSESKALQTQAAEYVRIKQRWSLEASASDFEYLKNHARLSKQEKRGGRYRFEFDNLTALQFDHLANRILNSMMMIKKLTLRKNSDATGTIVVEVEG